MMFTEKRGGLGKTEAADRLKYIFHMQAFRFTPESSFYDIHAEKL